MGTNFLGPKMFSGTKNRSGFFFSSEPKCFPFHPPHNFLQRAKVNARGKCCPGWNNKLNAKGDIDLYFLCEWIAEN